jgi:hypothetical protein
MFYNIEKQKIHQFYKDKWRDSQEMFPVIEAETRWSLPTSSVHVAAL